MVELSIVIVNYNGSGFIEGCINSIIEHLGENTIQVGQNLKENLNFEVIIVDNASTDGSLNHLKSICSSNKGFHLIQMKENTGFGRASNEGAGIARAKFLLFLNPDCKITGGEIRTLLNFYKSSRNPGVIGAKILGETGDLHYSCRSFPTLARQFYESYFLHRIFPSNRVFGSYFMSWWDHSKAKKVDWLAGSFMLIDRELFNNIKGFDTDYFMYSEDIQLCLDLSRKSFNNYYYPGYSIIHADSGIASRDMAERESGIWESRHLYFSKNHSLIHAFCLNLLYLAGLINRIIVFGIASLIDRNIRKQKRITRYFGAIKNYFFRK